MEGGIEMCCGKHINLPKRKIQEQESKTKNNGPLKYFKKRANRKKEKTDESTV